VGFDREEGKVVNTVPLKSSEEMTLARLILASNDMLTAQLAVQRIVDKVAAPNDPTFNALTCHAVIAYARPFKKSKGYPRLPTAFEQFPHPRLREIHELVIMFRDQCIAHSDKDVNTVELIPNVPPATDRPGEQHPPFERHLAKGYHLELTAFPVFKDVCMLQGQRLAKEIAQEKQRLYGTADKPIPRPEQPCRCQRSQRSNDCSHCPETGARTRSAKAR
jgi:hypothetical protein